MQNRIDAPDRVETSERAERIAALQRLLAQALESGISARSVQEYLPACGAAQATREQRPGTP